MCCQQWLRFPSVLNVLLLSGVLTISGGVMIGCEEANHDLADPPNRVVDPAVDPAVTVDPERPQGDAVESVRVDGIDEQTDVEVDRESESGAETRQERREERRERVREALEDVDVDVDSERTDVQIGDGEVDIEAR